MAHRRYTHNQKRQPLNHSPTHCQLATADLITAVSVVAVSGAIIFIHGRLG